MPKPLAGPIIQDLRNAKSLIAQAFGRFTPPADPFDPDGDWTHVYRDVSSLGLKWTQGEVSVRHRPKGRLSIESFRNCPSDYRYYTMAELTCQNDGFCSPTEWTVESKVAKSSKDAPYLNSGMVKKARVDKGVLSIQTGKDTRTINLAGSYTCKLCLLGGVGRLATRGTKEVEFTLLDEYDEPLPDQKITLRGNVKATTRGGIIDVTCYQHTGTGTMPGVYYVDGAGRVLFYLAGMQLLALTKVNGKATGDFK